MSDAQMIQAQQNLQKYWGYDSFREGQDDAIRSVLDGKNTVVLFPTGGGKSLCYQVPATVFEGLTLVISPLVALMQDQVQQLKHRDVAATFINSTLSSWEVEQRLVNARNGMYKLLYCAPERLKTTLWEAELPNLNIDLVAIDEAHCISEWGHDFRPSYRDIPTALESVADSVRWIALTATATPEVRKDIIHNLGFDDPVIISKGFQRDNLKWWVVAGAGKDQNLIRSVQKASAGGAGIVYGGTRRNCERLADLLHGKLNIETAAYHAGIDSKKRRTIQDDWVNGKTEVVVATNAFGMGIDKADCRFVIHYEMPYSLEAYYQQAGRAGRDGRQSYPLLLFKEADAHKAVQRIKDSYPGREQLQKVYDAVCDSLNLAVGSLEEEMREVSIPAIKKRTHLSPSIVRSSLKALKHLGIIEMAEYVVPQVGLQFIINPDYLRDKIKEEKNSTKAEFLDTLYRQFGGEAFEDIKYLELEYIKKKLDVTQNGLIKGLQVLQNHDNMLRFEVIGELPLVRPVDERMSMVRLIKSELESHRDNLLLKLEHMQGYIETEGCREVYIRTYFGEEDVPPCGHCDNCLRDTGQEKEAITSDGIRKIEIILNNSALSFKEIQQQLQWNRTRLKRHITHLVREDRLIVEGNRYRWNS